MTTKVYNDANVLNLITKFLQTQASKLRLQANEVNQARTELANIAADVEDDLLMREVVEELRSAR